MPCHGLRAAEGSIMSTGVQIVATVMGIAWSLSAFAVAAASPGRQNPSSPVLLTEVVSSGGDALRQAAGSGDIALLLNAPNLSATDAHEAVFAVQDAQSAGRDVIAIVESDLEDGSAVVAAACQGMVTVGSATLTGCTDSWCGSPSRRDALAAQLTQVGGRDPAIAARLLGGTSPLWYSLSQGPQQAAPRGGTGSIGLAQQGKPMKLDGTALQLIGWAGLPQADVASAMAAIAAGQVKVQPQAPTRRAGAGSAAPPPPQGNAAPPAPPAGALPAAAATEFANIQKDLTTLKATIQKFNEYFTGEAGVWTEKSKSLRDVWKYKDMTKDRATAQSCSDLQAQLIALADGMLRSIESVKRTAKGAALPQRDKLAALEKNLNTLKGDLSYNRSRGYEVTSEKLVDATIK